MSGITVTNDLEKKIDDRLNELITESYSRSDGGFDRARYQKLVAQRMSGRLDGQEKKSFQNSEYFDKEHPVFSKIMKGDSYADDAHEYAKNLERLKRMDAGRDRDELKRVRTEINEYLGKGYGSEKGLTSSVEQATSVPELFVKERTLDSNAEFKLVNVADLVNHIHYKILVDRDIPTDSDGVQYSYENINTINKAARERLAPYVKAFLATYEMTPQMVRRVYSKKDTNMLPGTEKPQPNSSLRGSVQSLASNLDNGMLLPAMAMSTASLGVPQIGGNPDQLYKIFKNAQAGGKKKKKSRGKKKSKKSKKSRKSKK